MAQLGAMPPPALVRLHPEAKVAPEELERRHSPAEAWIVSREVHRFSAWKEACSCGIPASVKFTTIHPRDEKRVIRLLIWLMGVSARFLGIPLFLRPSFVASTFGRYSNL
jgi:hypothetical protein